MNRLTHALVLVGLGFGLGCFREPKVGEGSTLVCESDDNCLPGWECTKRPGDVTAGPGFCVKADAATREAPTATSDGFNQVGADGATPLDGRTLIDGTRPSDSSAASDGSAAIDGMVALDGAPDVPISVDLSTDDGSGTLSDRPSVGMDAGLSDGPAFADGPLADFPIIGTGGATGTGGSSGTGGAADAHGTGGSSGTGGVTSTGGAGMGGSTADCSSGTKCSGNAVQTCSDGQWTPPVDCGPHQRCEGPEGTGQCTCIPDAVCSGSGPTCASASSLASCVQDGQGCLYQASIEACDVCSGTPGSAACCSHACTLGTSCLSAATLQTCETAASGCAAATNTDCSSGTVCERYAPAACLDPAWAAWPMPNGLTDVALGAGNLASYTDNGDGTITDNVTQLMWQKSFTADSADYAAAVNSCGSLSLAGHDDWRAPSLIELYSLVDVGVASPTISTTYFPATPSIVFWTTTRATAGTSVRTVDFTDGTLGSLSPGVSNVPIRCVR